MTSQPSTLEYVVWGLSMVIAVALLIIMAKSKNGVVRILSFGILAAVFYAVIASSFAKSFWAWAGTEEQAANAWFQKGGGTG